MESSIDIEIKCGECGAPMVLRTTTKFGGRRFYGCTRYPECKSTHGCHQKTGKPLGIPGDKETKAARIAAHETFDKLWITAPAPRHKARRAAYEWLAERLGISTDDCHIGRFDMHTCELAIAICQEKLKQWRP